MEPKVAGILESKTIGFLLICRTPGLGTIAEYRAHARAQSLNFALVQFFLKPIASPRAAMG